MIILYLLIPVSLLVAAGFLGLFLWAARSGQYDDTVTPSFRMLHDDGTTEPAPRDRAGPRNQENA